MASKGTLTVRIIGDDRSFNGAIGRMQSGLGSILGPIGKVGAAFGGMALAAGSALIGIGNEFDKVQDTIRIGTGATGKNLEGLMDDFRAVARDVPATFEDISTAVADLNTRLGLTGEPLQEVAAQVLNLSRLTGSDLSQTIPAVTRLMKDWGVESEDIASALDDVFVAAQATGIGIDDLAQKAVQFGSPLRQLGFSFEETLALFGAFEQQGVNIESVMSGLRQSIGRFAREGEAPAKALRRVIEEIETLDSAAANARAIEVFGARAGPDLAAAIQEGRFNLEDLVKAIETSEESIERATEDTDGFAEAWQSFKNNVLLALEGPATQVFGRLEELAQGLIPVVQDVADAFEREGLTGAMEVIKDEWEEAWPGIEKFLEETVLPAMKDLGSKAIRAFVDGINEIDIFPDIDLWVREQFEKAITGLDDLWQSPFESPPPKGAPQKTPVPKPAPIQGPERVYNPDRDYGTGGRTVSSAGTTTINVYNPAPAAAEQDISREMRLRYP